MCEGELCVYVFGYGSLMWRPGFPYLRKFDGYIKGWKRVFWQGSTDHRGTPSHPGRVVTLIKEPSESLEAFKTWGVVYCIPEADVSEVLKGLDYREKGGYVREEVDVFILGNDSPVVRGAIVYLADQTNQEYLGEAPVGDIALQIFKSVGPSGPNIDYLLNLASALKTMSVEDEHVFEIETHVRGLMKKEYPDDNETPDGADPPENLVSETGSSGNSSGCDSDSETEGRKREGSDVRRHLQHKYLVVHGCSSKGIIVVDNGAMSAVSNRGKSLLAAGIVGVQGSFLHHDLVNITDTCGRVVARGYPSYGSEEIERIKGKHSNQIGELLGFDRGEAVVLNQNMILV